MNIVESMIVSRMSILLGRLEKIAEEVVDNADLNDLNSVASLTATNDVIRDSQKVVARIQIEYSLLKTLAGA